MYDILFKDGRIVDPSQDFDFVGDVAVKGKSISYVGPSTDADAARVIPLRGSIICPGLIDVHTHVNYRGQLNGAPADLSCLPNGVTCILDAGSTGVSAYPALAHDLQDSHVRGRLMLNVSPMGLLLSNILSEPVDPSVWCTELIDKALSMHGQDILGFKLRISRDILRELGVEILDAACVLAEKYHKIVMIHTTDPAFSMGTAASHLRSGDILSHIFHGTGRHIFETGNLDPAILAAQKRGVIMDVSCGRTNFSLAVAQRAIAEGFLPDTISTDISLNNWGHPFSHSLPAVMSKMMALGMSLREVIACSSTNAAKALGEGERLGTLKIGTPADITVLRAEERMVDWSDIFGNAVTGHTLLEPLATVVDGELLYHSIHLL